MTARDSIAGGGRGTPRVPPGAGGPVVTIPPLTQVRFVDWSIGDDAAGDGSIAKPYKTIQRAIADIPSIAAPAPEAWAIYISPGQYDEDLAIALSNRHVALMGLGPWSLGNFSTPSVKTAMASR